MQAGMLRLELEQLHHARGASSELTDSLGSPGAFDNSFGPASLRAEITAGHAARGHIIRTHQVQQILQRVRANAFLQSAQVFDGNQVGAGARGGRDSWGPGGEGFSRQAHWRIRRALELLRGQARVLQDNHLPRFGQGHPH